MFVLVQLCTKDINSSGKLSPGSCPLPAATNWLWMATTNGQHGKKKTKTRKRTKTWTWTWIRRGKRLKPCICRLSMIFHGSSVPDYRCVPISSVFCLGWSYGESSRQSASFRPMQSINVMADFSNQVFWT